MTGIGLRPATTWDEEFCFQLHKAAMGPYVGAIWGWEDEVQRRYLAGVFTPEGWQIITVGGQDAGVLCVEHRPTEIYLVRLEVHPDYQGLGIGTHLIRALLDEADRRGKELALDVLAVNQRAHALYQRLGLRDVTRHGDNNIKIMMRSTRHPQ